MAQKKAQKKARKRGRKPREGPSPKAVSLRIEPDFYDLLERAAQGLWRQDPDEFSKNSISGYVVKFLRIHQDEIEGHAKLHDWYLRYQPSEPDRSAKHLSPQGVRGSRKKIR